MEFHTTNAVNTDQVKKQRQTRRVSQTIGRPKKKKSPNPQMKGKEESPEGMLNEIEVNQLSDLEFKIMVIRKLNELMRSTTNYRETMRNLLQTTSK